MLDADAAVSPAIFICVSAIKFNAATSGEDGADSTILVSIESGGGVVALDKEGEVGADKPNSRSFFL